MGVGRTIVIAAFAASASALSGCAAEPASAPAAQEPVAQQSTGSILVGSTPASGSTVQGPVDELKLRFNPPARLDEVTVTGPGGTMPMMVHAVGEVADYSLPLSGLGPGNYTVNWKAVSGGQSHQGSFAFTVR